MKIFIYFFLLKSYFDLCFAKVQILPEELIEKCPENVDNDAGYFGVDGLEVMIESDTDIFLNGSVKMLKELKSPWLAEYYAEQFYRDAWVRSPIQRKFDDLCLHFHSPTEMWYKMLKDIPGCPFKAGAEWKFNMVSLTDWPMTLPRNFIGKWRMNFIAYFEIDGKKMSDCSRAFFEIADV